MSYEIKHDDLIFVVEPYYDGEALWATVKEIKGCESYDLEQLGNILRQTDLPDILGRKLRAHLRSSSEDDAAFARYQDILLEAQA